MSESKPPRTFNYEQRRQLTIAQIKLENGVYSFRQYHDHLTTQVYNT